MLSRLARKTTQEDRTSHADHVLPQQHQPARWIVSSVMVKNTPAMPEPIA